MLLPYRGRCYTCGHDHGSGFPHALRRDLTTRADGMPASADERYLRRLLAQFVCMPGAYFDDGEAQGSEHGVVIDFMREPVADLDLKLRALSLARFQHSKPLNAGAKAQTRQRLSP